MLENLKEKLEDTLLGGATVIASTVVASAIWFGTVYVVQEPDNLNVAEIQHESNGLLGYTTTRTMEEMIEVLLDQPLGYVSNDIVPPFIFLDDRPNWELGVVRELRNISLAMQDEFSRPTSSKPDPDLIKVQNLLRNDHDKWIATDFQTRLTDALEALQSYRTRLMNDNPRDGQFTSKSIALTYWLRIIDKELDGITQKLSASRGELQTNKSTVGDSGAQVAWADSYVLVAETPWLEIDDVFWESRGHAWALLALFKAIRVDFASTLEDKQAAPIVDQTIRELSYALQPVDFPYVFNGSKKSYGMTPNYSIKLSSDITRASKGITNLITLLDNG